MLNHITIMGRLTRDPELRRTQSGLPVASFTLAVDRDYSGKNGGEKQTDFIDCVAWRSTAEYVTKYFSKGRMAVAAGRLQLRDWTDQNGSKRRAAEVIVENMYFGDSKRDTSGGSATQQTGYGGNGGYGGWARAPEPPAMQNDYPDTGYVQTEFSDDVEDGGRLPF